MASNFKMSVRRNRYGLQLNIEGDFDGTLACEVLNLLREPTEVLPEWTRLALNAFDPMLSIIWKSWSGICAVRPTDHVLLGECTFPKGIRRLAR